MAHWIVKRGSETPEFATNIENPMFSGKIEDAIKLDKAGVSKLFGTLMKMQESSSFSEPDDYTLVCVKS